MTFAQRVLCLELKRMLKLGGAGQVELLQHMTQGQRLGVELSAA